MTFEFDLNLYRVDRDVYSILDWIGDVGGLFEGLYLIFTMLIFIFKFNDFQHFLIELLYKKSLEEDQEENERDDVGSIQSLSRRKTSWLRQKLNTCLPNCILNACKKVYKPCALRKEEQFFAKARHNFQTEVDIVNFLKRIRRLEAYY